jgi:hypothetical protein
MSLPEQWVKKGAGYFVASIPINKVRPLYRALCASSH